MIRKKILFSIPLYYNSEDDFKSKWDSRFEKNFHIKEHSYSIDQLYEFRQLASKLNPCFHKYNDIIVYAELVIEGGDILIYYCLNGDQRKKFNDSIFCKGRSKQSIYPPFCHEYGGRFKVFSNFSIIEALKQAVKKIEFDCKNWNIKLYTGDFLEKIHYFDFEKYLENENCPEDGKL